jgi:hypothetical protein
MNWFPEDLVSAYADGLLAEEPDPPRRVSLGRLLRANVFLALILLIFPAAVAVVATLFSGGRSALPFLGVALGFSILFATLLGQGVFTARDALARGVNASGLVTRVDLGYKGSKLVTIRVDGTESQVARSSAYSALYVGDTVQVLADPDSHQVLLVIGVIQPAPNPTPPAGVASQNKINAWVFTIFGAIGIAVAIATGVVQLRIVNEVAAHNAAGECSAPSQAVSGTECRWVGQATVLRNYEDQNSRPYLDLSFDGLAGYTFTADFARGQETDVSSLQPGDHPTAELWQGTVIQVNGLATGNDPLLLLPGMWMLTAFFGLLGVPLLIMGVVSARTVRRAGRVVRPAGSTPAPSVP